MIELGMYVCMNVLGVFALGSCFVADLRGGGGVQMVMNV